MPDEAQVTYVAGDGLEVTTSLAHADAREIVEGQPVREFPVYVGRRHYSGYFWSATMGRHVVYESLLELSWLWLADFDAGITRIAAQPMRLLGTDRGRSRSRIPDFLCIRADRSVHVVDVKPAHLARKPEVADSLRFTGGMFHDRGWSYEVWTGSDPVKLRNIQMLAGTRLPHAVATLEPRSVIELVGVGCTIADLEQRLRAAKRPSPRREVLGALWRGVLGCDLARPIGPETVVEPAVV